MENVENCLVITKKDFQIFQDKTLTALIPFLAESKFLKLEYNKIF